MVGHVWAGDGDGNIIEADATKPGTAIIRSIATGGKGRVDELAYDPINRIPYAENDGDTPPRITFVSVTDGTVLGHYVYPVDQDGMEQPVWVRQTGLFYQRRRSLVRSRVQQLLLLAFGGKWRRGGGCQRE